MTISHPLSCPVPAEWEYDGMLCVADTTDTGAMWECPLLLELQELPDSVRPCGLGRRGASSLRSRSESFRCCPHLLQATREKCREQEISQLIQHEQLEHQHLSPVTCSAWYCVQCLQGCSIC